MEKCPPAEACRDAFERMSKATVQMCLSTPGFGFSKERDHDTPRPVKPEPNINETMSLDPQLKQEYTLIAPKPWKTKRPPPQFDMDLRGLFPEDLDSNIRPSSSFPLTFPERPQQQASQMQLYQDNSGQRSQQLISPASSINSQINIGLSIGQTSLPTFAASQQLQSQSFGPDSYSPDYMDVSTLPGMDFLNLANSMNDSSSAAINDDGYDFTSGMEIGFGVGNMGLDFQHDWSDGQQYDLFDGFFFGNNAMNGSHPEA